MARPPGTYSLLIAVDAPTTVEVGALGATAFDAERYVYTGSAFGAGGLGRVDRHREVAAGERETRHWHLDYLLVDGAARFAGVWSSPGVERECEVASSLPGAPVDGFGASDCDCAAHLVAASDGDRVRSALDRLHERRGVPE